LRGRGVCYEALDIATDRAEIDDGFGWAHYGLRGKK